MEEIQATCGAVGDGSRSECPGGLDLRVLDADSNPIHEFTLVFEDDVAVESEHGSLRVARSRRGAPAVVHGVNLAPEEIHIPDPGGTEAVIGLSRPGSVAGVAVLRGDEVPETLPLRLISRRPFLEPSFAVPRGEMLREIHLRVGDDGRFVIRNLPPVVDAFFETRSPYFFDQRTIRGSGNRRVDLVDVTGELSLRLRRELRLTARVLREPNQEPAAGESLTCRAATGASTRPIVAIGTVGEGGDVVFAFPVPGLDRVEVRFGEEALLRLDERIDRDRDLGVFVVGAPSDLEFLVTDDEGEPIATAIALIDGRRFGATSAEDGRLLLSGISSASRRLQVGARGFSVAEFELSEIGSERLFRVTLGRVPGLRLRVLGPDGEPYRHAMVMMSSEGPLFRLERDIAPSRVDLGLGYSVQTRCRVRDGQRAALFRADESGLIELSNVEPGTAVRAWVVSDDTFLEALSAIESIEFPRGGVGEHTIHAQAWPPPPRDVRGLVLSAGMKPVAGARVLLHAPGESGGFMVHTRSDGTFVFDAVTARKAELDVIADGFRPLRNLERPLEAGAELRFLLEPD